MDITRKKRKVIYRNGKEWRKVASFRNRKYQEKRLYL